MLSLELSCAGFPPTTQKSAESALGLHKFLLADWRAYFYLFEHLFFFLSPTMAPKQKQKLMTVLDTWQFYG
jgi:hypothetical protein